MARLIDAEKLEELMCRQCNIERWDEPCEPDDCFVLNVIRDSPTVDAVPVVHGRWISHYAYVDCSECGESADEHYKYCPNCGATMDLEVSDGN